MLPQTNHSQIIYLDSFSQTAFQHVFSNITDYGFFKTVLSLVLSVLAFFFHWIFDRDALVEAFVAIMVLILLDTMTGVAKAWQKGRISSGGFFRFVTKILVYIALLVTGILVDRVMPVPFASVIMTTFLAATEAISVMENLSYLGFPVPTALLKRLKSIRADELSDK